MRNRPVYIGLGLPLLIGLGIFSLGARNLWRAIISYSWHTTPATVVHSATESSAASAGRSSGRNSSSAVMDTAQIQFQYQVNGRQYKTDQPARAGLAFLVPVLLGYLTGYKSTSWPAAPVRSIGRFEWDLGKPGRKTLSAGPRGPGGFQSR